MTPTVPTATVQVDPQSAIDLGNLLDETLERFARENEALLRKACAVPTSVQKLDVVVICTFLGHTLDRLSARTGRSHTEEVVSTVLDDVTAARDKERREQGTVQ
jgi:hypothetical protein